MMDDLQQVRAKILLQILKHQGTLVFKQMCEDIVNVQPMDPNFFKDLRSISKDEKWLKENGYRPVSRTNLMWIKDNE